MEIKMLEITIQYVHPAWNHIPKSIWQSLLLETNSYNSFNGQIVRIADKIASGEIQYPSRKGLADLTAISNEFKGDVFECHGEHFCHRIGPAIGIWKPKFSLPRDWGVDFTGVGNDGEAKVGQIKFRSDADAVLDGRNDGLDGFIEEGFWTYKIKPGSKNFLIITNTKGVNYKDCIYRWKDCVSWITPNSSYGIDRGKKFHASGENRMISLRQLTDAEKSENPQQHQFW